MLGIIMKSRIYHVLFWLIYFWYCFITDYFLEGQNSILFELIFFITHNLVLFYGLTWSLNLFSKNITYKSLKIFFAFFLVVITFLVARYMDYFYVFPIYFNPVYRNVNIIHLIIRSFMWIIQYLTYALAYYFYKLNRQKQFKIIYNERNQFERNKHQLSLENSLLRSQINPHFLHNTLNFFYAKTLPISKILSESVLKLSDIMRYSLAKQTHDGLAMITEEIEHLLNVIDLAVLKYSADYYLHLDIDDFSSDIRILPLILITLAENIFKHGDISDPDMPAVLSIKLLGSNYVRVITFNKKSRIDVNSTHIGLKNTTDRLSLAYGEDFKFEILNKETTYQVLVEFPIYLPLYNSKS